MSTSTEQIEHLRSDGVIGDAELFNHSYKAIHPRRFSMRKKLRRRRDRWRGRVQRRKSEIRELTDGFRSLFGGQSENTFPGGWMSLLFFPLALGLLVYTVLDALFAAIVIAALSLLEIPFARHRSRFDRKTPPSILVDGSTLDGDRPISRRGGD